MPSETKRYRTLFPLRIGGSLVGVGQVVDLPPIVAEEHVEAGRLQPLPDCFHLIEQYLADQPAFPPQVETLR